MNLLGRSTFIRVSAFVAIVFVVVIVLIAVIYQRYYTYPFSVVEGEHLEEWASAPDEPMYDLKWTQIPSSRIHLVLPWRQAEAQELLRIKPIHELTDDQFGYLTNSEMKELNQFNAFLVRSIRITNTEGEYKAYEVDNMLWARYVCVLSGTGCRIKDAVIVRVPSKPKRVFSSPSVGS
jgi:hypothetical protein